MTRVPLRWIGASRKAALSSIVEERCNQWLRRWSGGETSAVADVEWLATSERERHPFDPRWYVLRARQAALYLHAPASVFEQIGCRFAGVAAADACGIAAGIGRRALDDLAAALLGTSLRESFDALPGMPDPADIDPRYGAAGVLIRLGAIRFELRLDAALCDQLAPAKNTAAPTRRLMRRQSALMPTPATFVVSLDLGRMPLAESIALKPGEIVKTAVPVDSVVRLRTPTGHRVLEGALVAADGHRAVRLLTRPTLSEKSS